MNNFLKASLPRKNFSDFAMSEDGRYLTVVSYLDSDVCAESFCYDFGISDTDSFKYLSTNISGSIDKRNFLLSRISGASNYIYSGNYFSDGSVFSSWDYGKTWTLNSGLKPKNWVSTSMSSDGKVQAIVGRGIYKNIYDSDVLENTPTHVYVSTDYGQTWEPKCSSRVWNAVNVSPDGSYIIASDCYPQRDFSKNGAPPILKHNILASSNTGNGWEFKYKAPIINYYLNSDPDYYSNLSSLDAAKSVPFYEYSYFGRHQSALSTSGKVQLIASPTNGVLVNKNFATDLDTTLNPSRIDSVVQNIKYLSGSAQATSDSFSNTTQVYSTAGRLFRKFLPICCDMSKNGQFQIVAGQGFKNTTGIDEISLRTGSIDGSSWLSNIDEYNFVNSDVYISYNSGNAWSGVSSLPKGLFCYSVSISDDARYIGILGRPNSKKFVSPDGTGRYGSPERYGSWANYLSGNRIGDNLIYYYSNNSGITWNTQERRNVNFSSNSKYSYFLSQKVLGNFSKREKDDARYYFNFPECEYLNAEDDIDNWNSRLKYSADGSKVAILDQSELLLSGFPIGNFQTPAKKQITLNLGSKSWDILKTGDRFIKDIQISDDGRCITYIINSGNLYEILSGQYPDINNNLKYILYSGNYSGIPQDVGEYSFSIKDSFKHGLIFSSINSGSTWSVYQTPVFSGLFNHKTSQYGLIEPTVTGFFPGNISKVWMSPDGRVQNVYSDLFYGSDQYITISQPDPLLDLKKRRLISPVYYSTNSGQSWSISTLETGPNGLKPASVCGFSGASVIYLLGENYGNADFKSLPTNKKLLRPDKKFLKKNGLLPFIRNQENKEINYSLPRVSLYGRALYRSANLGLSWTRIFNSHTGLMFSGISSSENLFRPNFVSAVSGSIPQDIYSACGGVSGVNFKESYLESVTTISNSAGIAVNARNVIGTEEFVSEYNTNLLNTINGTDVNGYFGKSFDLSENQQTLVVGASGASSSKGKVIIYNKIANEWEPVSSLLGTTVQEGFGSSVSVDSLGIKFIVGIPNSTNQQGNLFAGRIKVFQKEGGGWIPFGSDLMGQGANDFFGHSVKINSLGWRIFVYAPNGGSVGSYSSRVFIYKYDYNSTFNWVQEAFIDLETNTDSLYLYDSIDIDDAGQVVAISRPQYKVNGKTGVVNIFKLNARTGAWERYLNEIALNNTNISPNSAYRTTIKLSKNGDKIAIFEEQTIRVYFAAENQWLQLGSDIKVNSGSIFSGTLSRDGKTIAFTNINENNNRGKLYVYILNTVTNNWEELPFVKGNGAENEQLALGKISFNSNADLIYFGVPNANSNTGLIYEFNLKRNYSLPKYRVECPYTHGRFLTYEFSPSIWTYKSNPLVDYYGFVPNGSNVLNRKQSLLFKDFKIASLNTGVQVAIANPIFGNSNDGLLMGGLYKYYQEKDLSSVYLTRDAWNTYECVSAPGVIGDLNISYSGDHISYLNKYDIYEYNENHVISENGSRYGIPFVSHDTGASFMPILNWDRDIESRKVCFIGNEWVSDSWAFSRNNLSGFLNNPIIDRSFDIYGTYFNFQTGYKILNYFTRLGGKTLTLSDFNSGYDEISRAIKNKAAVVSSAFVATKDHLNTTLYRLRFSPNGRYGLCVENGQITGSNLYINGDIKEQYFLILSENDGTTSLNNKIYINDRYGDSNAITRQYLNYPNQSEPDFLFNNFSNVVPQTIKYNNPIKVKGNLFKADTNKKHYIYCNDNIISAARIGNNQTLYTYAGTPVYTNTNGLISSIQGSNIYELKNNRNLFTEDGLPMSSFSFAPGTKLPAGLSLDINTMSINGVPTQTGYFICGIVPLYCNNSITGKASYFGVLVSTGANQSLESPPKAVFVNYPSGGKPVLSAKVKQTNFIYPFSDKFYSYNLSGISGYGNISLSPAAGTELTGLITGNYSGYFNLLSFETGTLSGKIIGDNSTYTWVNVPITGSGRAGSVYYDLVTGYKTATNEIKINFNTIQPGESIIFLDINSSLTYTNNQNLLQDPSNLYFNNINTLANKINTRLFPFVTGSIIDSNTIKLFSKVQGENGNSLKISRNITSPSSILIASRYFTGGADLRQQAAFWDGNFSTTYNSITKENSGIYSRLFLDDIAIRNISGAVWDNAFNKNYTLTTGLYSSSIPGFAKTGSILFNPIQNKYIGSGVIPSGQSVSHTGVKIAINRNKYQDSNNDFALYTISGTNFLYSGVINL